MNEDSKCPLCGSETVVRISKKGPNAGRKFNVCDNYPSCKGRVAVGSVEKRLKEWKTECGRELTDGFFEDYYRIAEEKQEILKKLTDDELMELSYSRVVSLAEWANTWLITGKFKSAEMDDLAFNEAVVKEVGMRMEIAYSS
ncbi:MAG: topoisomerase DNA-binding C4 zinc finger domain-containing protein, partial [Dehalococcoidia bacterium]|nr:topoisomerase DNA-binding C4 zinc finger domain-containing protein [Dehalococcoidia bacterium]